MAERTIQFPASGNTPTTVAVNAGDDIQFTDSEGNAVDAAVFLPDGENLIVVLASGEVLILEGFYSHDDDPPEILDSSGSSSVFSSDYSYDPSEGPAAFVLSSDDLGVGYEPVPFLLPGLYGTIGGFSFERALQLYLQFQDRFPPGHPLFAEDRADFLGGLILDIAGPADPAEPPGPSGPSGPNSAPFAFDDIGGIGEDGVLVFPANIGVLKNDLDGDGDSLTIVGVNGAPFVSGTPVVIPSGATLTLNADGSYIYDPTGAPAIQALGPTDNLEDTFTYTVSDGRGGRDSASVTIFVGGANDIPVAGDDSVVTDKANSIEIDVLGNDSDADDQDDLIVTLPGATSILGAAISVNPDGSVNYDPTGVNLFMGLGQGVEAMDSFTYTISDGNGATATATVDVTVTGNLLPSAEDDILEVSAVGNTAGAVPGILGNDTDPDLDPLVVLGVDGNPANVGTPVALPTGGLITVLADGSFLFDPNNSYQFLGEGQVSGGSGGDLPDLLAQLDLDNTGGNNAIIDQNPTPFFFELDEGLTGNEINDGGDDMYDGGNHLNTELTSEFSYTGGVITAADGIFGAGSSYFTRAYGPATPGSTGVFVMAADNISVNSFSITGNNGADGDGTVDGGQFSTTVNGSLYTTFYKRVNEQDSDPSINHLIIVEGDGSGITHTFSNDTDDDDDQVTGLQSGGVSSLYYLLVAGANSTDIPLTSLQNTVDAFLGSLGVAGDTFTYTITDGFGGTDTATAVVAVEGVNDAPTANPDTQTVTKGRSTNIDVLANDTDPDNNASLSVSLSSGFSAGGAAISVNPDGTILYDPTGVPAFDALGQADTLDDTFTYTIDDGFGGIDTAGVTVTVTGNSPPVAVDDSFSASVASPFNVPAGVGLLTNDTDPDMDPLVITHVQGTPIGGAILTNGGALVTVNPDGSYTYDGAGTFPELGGSPVLFGADGQGGDLSDLLVFDPNTGDEIGNIGPIGFSITGLAYDTATGMLYGTTGNNALISNSLVQIDPRTGQGTLIGSLGVTMPDIAFGPDGLLYGFSNGGDALYTIDLATGGATQVGAQTLTSGPRQIGLAVDPNTGIAVFVGDDNGDEVIQINPLTGAVISRVFTGQDDIGGAATFSPSGILYSVDKDDGSIVIVDPLTGTVTDLGGGNSNLDAIVFAGLGRDSFTYTISDGFGGTSSATVTADVTGVNDAPTANNDNAFTSRVNDVDIDALANDTDPDVGDGLTSSLASPTSTLGATVTINPDGTFNYDPSTSATLTALGSSQLAVDTFTYTIEDRGGLTDTATVSVTVLGNSPPEAVADTAMTDSATPIVVGAPLGLLANDTDPDGDSFFIKTVNGNPAIVGTTLTLPSGALVTINADGSYDFDPNGAFDAASAGQAGGGSGGGKLFALGANDNNLYEIDPATGVATLIGPTGFDGLDGLVFNPTDGLLYAFGNDNWGSDAGVYTINTSTGAATYLGGNIDGVESAAFSPSTGQLFIGAYNHADNVDPGIYTLDLGTFAHSFVTSSNHTHESGMVFGLDGVTLYRLDDDSDIQVVNTSTNASSFPGNYPEDARGASRNPSDDLVYMIDNDGELHTIDLTTGALTLIGNTNLDLNSLSFTGGPDQLTYSITDGNGGADMATVTFEVTGINDDPTANPDTGSTDYVTPINIDVLGNDTDPDTNDTLTPSVGAMSALGGTLGVNMDGTISYDPTTIPGGSLPAQGATAVDTFTYSITDGNGGTSSSTVSVTVAGNATPDAVDDVPGTDADMTLTVAGPAGLLANDTDPDMDMLSIKAVNGSAGNLMTPLTLQSGATVTVNGDGSYTYDPSGNFDYLGAGEINEALYAVDGRRGSDNDSQLYILDPNTGAVLQTIGATGVELRGIAFDPTTGILYGSTAENEGSPRSSLVTINTTTGAATVIGPTASAGMGDLAFDSAGNLFGWDNDSDDLFSIDKTTGAATVIGNFNNVRFAGLAIDGSDNAFYLGDGDLGSGVSGTIVVPVDTTTGVASGGVNQSGTNSGTGATFNFNGELFAINNGSFNSLMRVDPVTGQTTLIGSTGLSGLMGLAFRSDIDTFTYTVTDTFGGMDTATVAVVVTGVNDDPTANPDTDATDHASPITIDVVGNDTDVDGDFLTPSVGAMSALGGTLGVNMDGTISYDPTTIPGGSLPAQGATAVDTFTYSITDGNGGTSSSTVSVTVAGNATPDAVDDVPGTDADMTLTVAGPAGLLANDTDPDMDMLSIKAVNGSAGNLMTPLTLQSGATVTVNGDGSYTYDPSGNFDYLGAGEINEALYAVDGRRGSDNDSQLYILDPNTGSVLQTIGATGVELRGIAYDSTTRTLYGSTAENEGNPRSSLVTINTSTGVATVVGSTSGQGMGDLAFDSAGNLFGWDNDSDDFFSIDKTTGAATVIGNFSNARFAGLAIDRFDNAFYVGDGNLGTGVNGTIVVPVDTGTGVATGGVNQSGTNSGTGATFSFDGELFAINNGSFNSLMRVDPVTGQTTLIGSTGLSGLMGLAFRSDIDTFTYTVTDTFGGMDTATVAVVVTGVNDDPTANPDTDATDHASPITIDVVGNDTDVDGDFLTPSVGAMSALGGTLGVNMDGTISYDPTTIPGGSLPAQGATAVDTFTYSITDGNGGTSSSTVSVTVAGNATPDAVDDTPITDADMTLTVAGPAGLLANDTDPDLDILSIKAVNGSAGNLMTPVTLQSGATVTVNGDGSYTYDPNGAFDYLGNGQTNETLYAVDGRRGSANDSQLYILDPNTGSVLQTIGATGVELRGIAYDSTTRTLYGSTAENEGNPRSSLVTINTSTGVATVVGSTSGQGMGDLAFDSAGNLFGWDNDSDDFFSIDKTTGAATVIGNFSNARFAGLAIDRFDNAFYVGDGNLGTGVNGTIVVPVDTGTGVATGGVNQSGTNSGTGATFNFNGELFAINNGSFNSLMRVDPVTGQTTLIGSTGLSGLMGLAFALDVDTFTYTVTDTFGGMDTATVSVVVTGVNDAPTATDDVIPPSFAITEDVQSTFGYSSLLSNDTDPDSNDVLTVTGLGTGVSNLGATLTDNGGTFTYDPTGAAALQALNTGDSAIDTFTYTISDGNGGTDTATVSLLVQGVNDPPLLAADGEGAGADAITEADVEGVFDAAVLHWAEITGLSGSQLEALNGTSFQLYDLPGAQLGIYTGSTILLDPTAAGNGWFVDGTPGYNSEFVALPDGTLEAVEGGAATGQVDLLTVLMHELGHAVGLDDTYTLGNESELHFGSLELGQRKLPDTLDFDSLLANATGSTSSEVTDVTIALSDVLQNASDELTLGGSSDTNSDVFAAETVALADASMEAEMSITDGGVSFGIDEIDVDEIAVSV